MPSWYIPLILSILEMILKALWENMGDDPLELEQPLLNMAGKVVRGEDFDGDELS